MQLSVTNNMFPNKHVNKNLDQIIRKNIISNGYIFHGPQGVGKKEAAIKFISGFIKKNNSKLNTHNKIIENNHPDFMVIEPTYLVKGKMINKLDSDLQQKQKNDPIIRVDQIREARIFLSKKSIESHKKFILIINSHYLNEASSNCLLKTLEEPSNGIFILLTSKLNLLLETITSRCQIIRFKSYTNEQLKFLINKNKDQSKATNEDAQEIENLIYLANGSPKKLLEIIDIWSGIPRKIKEEIKNPILNYLSIFSISKYISDELDFNQQEFLVDYIQYIWWKKTLNKNIISILEEIKKNLRNNIQPRLSWEVNLLKIALKDY